MADAHGGGEEGGGGGNMFVDAIFWILLFFVVISLIGNFASNNHLSFDFLPSLSSIFASVFGAIQVLSVFVCLLFLIGIIYFHFKLGNLFSHGHGHGHDHHGGGHGHGGHATSHEHYVADHIVQKHTNPRWEMVEQRINSFNESDWRLAILESDVILDDMLQKMGYQGDTIADRLKQVEKSDFATIDDAWEAHKVRNRIAHDGVAFHLTHNEAERVIKLYQKVFEEFYFI